MKPKPRDDAALGGRVRQALGRENTGHAMRNRLEISRRAAKAQAQAAARRKEGK